MSTSRRPARGPQPRAVYRRRRLMVGATLVLLVVAGVDLVNGDDGGPDASGADDTVQQVDAAPRAETTAERRARWQRARAAREQARTPSPEPEPAPAPEPAEPDGPCTDDDVVVSPEVGQAVAGSRVELALTLTTRESAACTWTISDQHLAYKVVEPGVDTDGDGQDDDSRDVWSSADCPALVPEATVVVRRGLPSTFRLAWNGRESSRDCPESMDHADPGDYAIEAAAIGGEPSHPVAFTLLDPADVEPAEPAGPAVPETKTDEKSEKKTEKSEKKKSDRRKTGRARPQT